MSKKSNLSLTAIGTTFAVSLAASPLASAADNPFELTDYASGYMVAEGNCGEKGEGEGKCGEKGEGEGKCGEKGEGEGKCGEKGEGEGKCGEGKCGN
ncbi:MAG: low-complexity protein [Gammaproteobacteria bacterium]|nr:low-complexity protein [Gammaproteobacteria bacterium]